MFGELGNGQVMNINMKDLMEMPKEVIEEEFGEYYKSWCKAKAKYEVKNEGSGGLTPGLAFKGNP